MDVGGISIDLVGLSQARKIVLVEGASDKAALEVLAERRGQPLGPGGTWVLAMGGATSIGHFLELLGPHGISARLAGLCDAAEEEHFWRAAGSVPRLAAQHWPGPPFTWSRASSGCLRASPPPAVARHGMPAGCSERMAGRYRVRGMGAQIGSQSGCTAGNWRARHCTVS